MKGLFELIVYLLELFEIISNDEPIFNINNGNVWIDIKHESENDEQIKSLHP